MLSHVFIALPTIKGFLPDDLNQAYSCPRLNLIGDWFDLQDVQTVFEPHDGPTLDQTP